MTYRGAGGSWSGRTTNLTDFDEVVLGEVITKVRAWEQINDPEFCSRLSIVGLRELMLTAGYPEDVVQEAINQHGNARLDADMVV